MMGCIQCSACTCAFYGLDEDECCGSSMAPCCYLYSCGMCDFDELEELGPCDGHKEMMEAEE